MSGLSGAAAKGDADSRGGSPVRHISLWPPPRSTRHSAKRRRNLILGLAAVLVLGSGMGSAAVWVMQRGGTADTSAVPESYAGTWRGEMSQVNEDGQHVADWGAEVKLERGEERGVAEWYTFDCRGSLTLTERTGDRLAFDYVETYDPETRCVDESDLVLKRGGSAGTLEARWTAVSHNGVPMTSTGTLR
ncbi:hypothetical protein LP52_00310 [Streptomonospora alba]|uniref:Uncharacterized protein n=1 Tax=Streptomonospora alba TaxID=183763 RepID=A0A0C2JH40_9ACTN|nr:hypothetical protein [Streptomonospora alba]KII00592.1 hypothetical protein LP52_00310 [Streptomonospora alba]